MNFKTLFLFVKKPQLREPVRAGIKQSILVLSKSVLWYYLFLFGSMLFIIPLMRANLWPKETALFRDKTFWDMVIYAPILEELAFRLPLRSFYRNFPISVGIFVYAFTNSFLGVYLSLCIALIIVIVPFFLRNYNEIELKTNQFFEGHFRYFFYLSVLTFGFVHISNFQDLEIKHYWISPLIVSFQLFMGLILGYLRVNFKFGIVYSFLAHALINLPLNLIKLL